MTRFLPLLLLGALLVGCGDAAGGDGDAAAADSTDTSTPVEVLIAETGLFEDIIELTGSVESPNDATLSPDVPGTLIYVAPIGASVRRGATIAQVDPSSAQAGVAQAQAGVAQAQAGIESAAAQVGGAEAGIRAARAQRQAAQAQVDLTEDQYRRQAALVRDSILSALEFRSVQSGRASARAQASQADAGIAQAEGQLRAARGNLAAAQSQRQAAEASLRAARTQLAKTRVTAPFSGVIEERMQEPGELASPGNPVVRLVAGGGVKVTAGVPERYAGEIEGGTQVQIRPTAYDAEPRGGRVTFVGQAINTASRTFPIEVALDNSDGALKPAMVVRMGVTRDVLRDVISVPIDAVVRDERGTSVFVVATDSVGAFVAERRVVELGPQSGATVVLTSGVANGEQIIVSGQGSLAERDRVRVTERRQRATPLAANDE